MKIVGMTDTKTLRDRSGMPLLGKLRKGSPKKKVTRKDRNGKEYEAEIQGKDLTHFRFTSSDARLVKRFERLFTAAGEGVENAIPFFLPYDDLEKSFPAAMGFYRGGSEYIRCDREVIYAERMTSTGGPWKNPAGEVVGKQPVGKPSTKWVDYSIAKRPLCRFPDCAKGKEGMESCSAKSALKIQIQELESYGVVAVLLGAKNDIPHVAGLLYEIKDAAEKMGIGLSQVPLLLWRSPRSISTPNFKDESRRQRVQKSLVEVGLNIELWNRMFSQRSQLALAAVVNEPAQIEGSNLLRLPEGQRADEFGEIAPAEFKTTKLWGDIKRAFDSCRSIERVQKCHGKALSYIDQGKLPKSAGRSLAILAENAKKRILDSGVQPLPEIIDVEVEDSPDVKSRVEAIANRVGSSLAEIEAIAKRLNPVLQVENIQLWSESDCQRLRDTLYSRCDEAVNAFESTDSSMAEYQAFLASQEGNASDDGVIWKAWRSLVEAATPNKKPIKRKAIA